jgi:hypothetical protein
MVEKMATEVVDQKMAVDSAEIYRQENLKARADLERAETRLADLELQLSASNLLLQKLSKELDDAHMRSNMLDEESAKREKSGITVDSQSESVEQFRAQLAQNHESLHSLKNELDQANEKTSSACKERDALKEENKKLNATVLENEQTIRALRHQVSDERHQTIALKQEGALLKEELDKTRLAMASQARDSKLTEAQEKISKLTASLKASELDKTVTFREICNINDRRSRIQAQSKELQAENATLLAENASLRDILFKIQQDIERGPTDESLKTVDKLVSDARDKQLELLKGEIDHLKSELFHSNDAASKAEELLSEYLSMKKQVDENGAAADHLLVCKETPLELQKELETSRSREKSLLDDLKKAMESAHKSKQAQIEAQKLINTCTSALQGELDMATASLRMFKAKVTELSMLVQERGDLTNQMDQMAFQCTLHLFYAAVNPSKLVGIEKMAKRYLRDQEKLNAELRERYGGLDLSADNQTLAEYAASKSPQALEHQQTVNELTSVSNRLQETQDQRDKLAQKVQQWKDETSKTKSDLDATRKASEQMLKEKEKQNTELSIAQKQRDKLAQEVQQLKAQISKTKSDLDSTRKEKEQQNTELGTAKSQRDKLAQEVQQLKAEISKTKSEHRTQLDSAASDVVQVRARKREDLNAVQEQLQLERQQINLLLENERRKVKRLQSEKTSLQKHMYELLSRTQESDSNEGPAKVISDLWGKIELMTEENNSTRTAYESLKLQHHSELRKAQEEAAQSNRQMPKSTEAANKMQQDVDRLSSEITVAMRKDLSIIDTCCPASQSLSVHLHLKCSLNI